MDWQPIETAPKGTRINHPWLVLARIHRHIDDDGEFTGEESVVWMQVGTWFLDQWQAQSGGFAGIGPNAWMPLRDPSHWLPLPEAPKT